MGNGCFHIRAFNRPFRFRAIRDYSWSDIIRVFDRMAHKQRSNSLRKDCTRYSCCIFWKCSDENYFASDHDYLVFYRDLIRKKRLTP